MKDDHTINSHYLTYTFLFKRLGECTSWTSRALCVSALHTDLLCQGFPERLFPRVGLGGERLLEPFRLVLDGADAVTRRQFVNLGLQVLRK